MVALYYFLEQTKYNNCNIRTLNFPSSPIDILIAVGDPFTPQTLKFPSSPFEHKFKDMELWILLMEGTMFQNISHIQRIPGYHIVN